MYHVPVRTTTLPLARSAYMNNSSSETIVVMTLVEVRSEVEVSAREVGSYCRLGWAGARWHGT